MILKELRARKAELISEALHPVWRKLLDIEKDLVECNRKIRELEKDD